MNDRYDGMWDELAKAIIRQAVEDWRTLIMLEKRTLSKKDVKISLKEIRQFFRSDYCRSLMDSDPLVILNQLEKELKRSREEGSLI